MWNKMIAVSICSSTCLLFAGCWITRNWKDYVPILDTALLNDVRTYSGYFYPQHNGVHALSLAIKTRSPDKTDIRLRFKGEVKIKSEGRTITIPFEKKLDDAWLPPTRFKLYLKTFYADAIKSSEDRGWFYLTIDGNLAEFLEREPDSSISVSLIDWK